MILYLWNKKCATHQIGKSRPRLMSPNASHLLYSVQQIEKSPNSCSKVSLIRILPFENGFVLSK